MYTCRERERERLTGTWCVAVRSCAGAFLSGDLGSNACPAGSVRIQAEAACRTAAAAAGRTFFWVETSKWTPRGCYFTNNVYATGRGDAFFNAHAAGGGWPGTQLLCAALTTAGAPLTPLRARVRAATRVYSAACLIIMQTAYT